MWSILHIRTHFDIYDSQVYSGINEVLFEMC